MTSQLDYDNLSLLYMKEEDYMNLKEAFRYQNKLQGNCSFAKKKKKKMVTKNPKGDLERTSNIST